MQNLRRVSQGLFLVLFLFLFLQTESKGNDQLGYPVKVFLDLDPLVYVTTLLASHEPFGVSWTPFYLSLAVIVATVLLGRVFCGWLCPMGTLNNIAGALKKKRKPDSRNWHGVKYYVLVFIIASSIFTLHLVGIMDPISLLIRSLSVSIYPLFNYGLYSLFDLLYEADIPVFTDVSEDAYHLLRGNLLAFNQPLYRQGVFIGTLFLIILGLNLYENRFFCRYLCPLGAMLGLLSRRSLLSRAVSEGCTECGECDTVCQGGASPHLKEGWRDAECLYCFNCDDVCPENAVSFGFFKGKPRVGMDLGRRRVLVSMVSGAVAVPLLRTTPLSISPNPKLIRPPGSLEESGFLRRCVKCGECMKVGYCEYRCTLCGQVCPTGAIEKLPLEKKVKVKIGLAMIDKNRCLPWAHATPCIVCEEVCPTPKKAVWFEKGEVFDRKGNRTLIKRPRVDLKLCIGCGICETKCPVVDIPAIYVTSIGESRSEDNRLLL
jgi:polyferredoxin/formate hydrogenlyase subunit 6/NADH:ubiquinone oxidoreductase subunit I